MGVRRKFEFNSVCSGTALDLTDVVRRSGEFKKRRFCVTKFTSPSRRILNSTPFVPLCRFECGFQDSIRHRWSGREILLLKKHPSIGRGVAEQRVQGM